MGEKQPAQIRDPAESGLTERILEATPVGIVVVEPSGELSFANERASELLGLPHEEITGRSYEELEWNIYHGDGTPVHVDEHPVTRVLETGEPDFGFEHWIELPDGTERWLSSNSAPVHADNGDLECVVVGIEDVTALKRREEKLTSEHVRFVEFRTDRSAVPPSLRDAIEGELRLEVESVVSLPDGTCVQYMSTEDLSANRFVQAVEEVPHFLDARLLSTSDGRCRIEAHARSATVSSVFPSLGGRPRAVIIGDDEVRFLGELPGDADPREVADGIRRFHSNVELVSQSLVYSPHLLYDVVDGALTDRQFAALETAYYGGYFDMPRTSTGDELAARFGVTRQTFNQHLRKAERIVFQHLFEKSGKDAR